MRSSRRMSLRFALFSSFVKFAPIFLVLSVALSSPVSAEPINSADIRVIDGDTIRVHHKQPNVRLVGFNAPETRRAACEAERELGAKATRRAPRHCAGGQSRFRICRLFLLPRNTRDASLQLREGLRNVEIPRSGCWGNLDGRRSRRAIRLWRNTLPENATPMVPVKEPLRRWRNAPRLIFVSIIGLSFTRLSRWRLWLQRRRRGRSGCPLLWRSLSISSR